MVAFFKRMAVLSIIAPGFVLTSRKVAIGEGRVAAKPNADVAEVVCFLGSMQQQ